MDPNDRTAEGQAACHPLDSELFFPDRAAHRTGQVAQAKAVCRRADTTAMAGVR
jgi:hypothetical protein